MCQTSKTSARQQCLDGSLVTPLREQFLEGLRETFERSLSLINSRVSPISDIVLERLRNGSLLAKAARGFNCLDVILKLRGLNAVEL